MRYIFRYLGLGILGFVAVALSGGASLDALAPTAPNPCFSGTRLCPPDQIVCITPVGACPKNSVCTHVIFPAGQQDMHYCICAGGGTPPDPRNQPDWDCGIAGLTGPGDLRGAVCLNSANCSGSEVCGMQTDSNGCYYCSCL